MTRDTSNDDDEKNKAASPRRRTRSQFVTIGLGILLVVGQQFTQQRLHRLNGFFQGCDQQFSVSDHLDDGEETSWRIDHHLNAYYHKSSAVLLQESQYKLNDQTMRLSPYVERRPWLEFHSNLFVPNKNNNNKHHAAAPPLLPKQKLVLTDFGWNNPDQNVALTTFPRSLRSRELLQAFIDHPLFDPLFSWGDMFLPNKTVIDPTLQYIVFMDIETCFESNYPYSNGGFGKNSDTQHGRVDLSMGEGMNVCYGICRSYIDAILESPLFQQAPNSTLLFWDCLGDGIDIDYRTKNNQSPQLSIVSISSQQEQLLPSSDMGLPPPATNPVSLTYQEQRAIETCQSESERPYLFTFVGSGRSQVRQDLYQLNNDQDVLSMEPHIFREKQSDYRFLNNDTYASILSKALFSGAPRGDNLFSYRFTEVLSGGAIPVVYADDWVLPFHPELVDWTQCAVIIPEAKASETMTILKQIHPKKRCQMRQYCYSRIYKRYMVNPEATIAGVLESIAAAAAARGHGNNMTSLLTKQQLKKNVIDFNNKQQADTKAPGLERELVETAGKSKGSPLAAVPSESRVSLSISIPTKKR